MSREAYEFDERLFVLKMMEPSRQLQIESQGAAKGTARAANGSLAPRGLLQIVDFHLLMLDKWLEIVDRISREVWQAQGKAVTTVFVSEILILKALTTIEARAGVIKNSIDRFVARSPGNSYAARKHLAVEVKRLKAKVANRYEIEEREIEHQMTSKTSAPDQSMGPKSGLEVPLLPLAKAPAPFTTSGGSWTSSPPRLTEVPENPPTNFPSEFWPQTNVILLKAQRRFPLQTQTVEMCKHIISEMIPPFRKAVEAGKINAGSVQREHGGGMEDLLHSLLVCNDPGPRSGWNLSDQAYRLGKEIRKSDEWLKLGEAIAETQQHIDSQTHKPSKFEPSPSVEQEVQKSAIIPGQLEGITNWRLTERTEHNLRTWLVEHGIPPTPEVLASFIGKDKQTSHSAQKFVDGGHKPSVKGRKAPKARLKATVNSPIAARRMESYLVEKAIGQTDFASTVQTTDRTLRAFRSTGKVRRDIFEAIAKAMGISKDDLLKAE